MHVGNLKIHVQGSYCIHLQKWFMRSEIMTIVRALIPCKTSNPLFMKRATSNKLCLVEKPFYNPINSEILIRKHKISVN